MFGNEDTGEEFRNPAGNGGWAWFPSSAKRRLSTKVSVCIRSTISSQEVRTEDGTACARFFTGKNGRGDLPGAFTGGAGDGRRTRGSQSGHPVY